ncbi:TPA: hypothetical protein RJD83_002674 [Legionella pneumophila]|nr:hypothetical protein [Legionella pneumophila]
MPNNFENAKPGQWQLAISIAAEALSNASQIDKIEKILATHLNPLKLEYAVFPFNNDDKFKFHAGHGAMIYFPDNQPLTCADDKLKDVLIAIWRDFKQQNIPLLTITKPGFKELRSLYPTPFSYNYVAAGESWENLFLRPWKIHLTTEGLNPKRHPFSYIFISCEKETTLQFIRKDGSTEDVPIENFKMLKMGIASKIPKRATASLPLKKTAYVYLSTVQVHGWITANGGHSPFDNFAHEEHNHPLPGIVFAKELYEESILFADEPLHNSLIYLHEHIRGTENTIKKTITELMNYETFYSDLLNDEDLIKDIWKLITQCKDKGFSAQQTQKALTQIDGYKSLVDYYPSTLEPTIDSFFNTLEENPFSLTEVNFYAGIEALKAMIGKDLQYIAANLSSNLQRELLRKAPALIELIIGRQIEIFYEKKCLENLKDRLLSLSQDGIKEYLKRPRDFFNSHLSLFSKVFFDTNRGKYRAQVYQAAFANPNFSKDYKLIILYALFNSTDGVTLQQDVASQCNIGDAEKARIAMQSIMVQLHALGTEEGKRNVKDFNDMIEEIVIAANDAKEESRLPMFSCSLRLGAPHT